MPAAAEQASPEEGTLNPLAFDDPGKRDRAEHGVPVVPAFDGYRAYSIIGAVFVHIMFFAGVLDATEGTWAEPVIAATLYQAPDVFFIVSGFVLFLPTCANRGDFGGAGAFAIRRAARVLPALWLSLLIVLLLIAFAPMLTNPMPGAGEILINLGALGGLAAFWDPTFPIGFEINGALWTITVEIGFYLVLPFIAARYYRHPFIGLATGAAIAIGWRIAFDHLPSITSFFGHELTGEQGLRLYFAHFPQTPQWAFSFAAGMTGAWIYMRVREFRDRNPALVERRALWVALAGLASLAFFGYLTGRYSTDTVFLVAPVLARQEWQIAIGYTASLTVVLVALTLVSRRLQKPLAHPFVTRLADISIGVFMIHFVILQLLKNKLGPVELGSTLDSFLALTAVVMPLSLAYGYLSARYVEHPVRRWAHRFQRGEHGDAAGKPAPAAAPHG